MMSVPSWTCLLVEALSFVVPPSVKGCVEVSVATLCCRFADIQCCEHRCRGIGNCSATTVTGRCCHSGVEAIAVFVELN